MTAHRATVDPRAAIWSRPEHHGAPIVVLLHGDGGDEASLSGLLPLLPDDATYVALRAPFPSPAGGGRWYEPDDMRLEHGSFSGDTTRIDAATRAIHSWAQGLRTAPIGVVGFSQGGFVAAHLLRTYPTAWRWAAVLSGGPFPAELPGDEALATIRPALFWGRGERDPMPVEYVPAIRDWFTSHSSLTEFCSPELGHDIDDAEGLALAAFIRAQLDQAQEHAR